jgi:cell envelope opacity-associated protein A
VLQKALLDAQLAYQKAIDEISATTAQKLAALKAQLAAVAAATAALATANAAYASAATAKTTTVPYSSSSPYSSTYASAQTPLANQGMTINQNFTATKVDPADVHLATVSAVKYGAAVTVNTTTLAGILKASGTSTSSSVNTSTGVSNKIKAAGMNIL